MSSKNYQPKDFFRRAPHDLLVQYFARHGVLRYYVAAAQDLPALSA